MHSIEKERIDAERYRKSPIYKTDFSKPVSRLVEDVRNDLTNIRGRLYDIVAGYPDLKDHIKHVEGLMTCAIVTLGVSREEIAGNEIRRDDRDFGESLQFGSRGVGTDSCQCFICGKSGMMGNISAFVKSREEGERIVADFFGIGAWLDFRSHEPNWIQVKVGGCKEHTELLEKLDSRVSVHGIIRKHDVDEIRKEAAGESSS